MHSHGPQRFAVVAFAFVVALSFRSCTNFGCRPQTDATHVRGQILLLQYLVEFSLRKVQYQNSSVPRHTKGMTPTERSSKICEPNENSTQAPISQM